MITYELNQSILKGGQRLPHTRIKQALKAVDRAVKGARSWHLSIAFVDEKTMKQLNHQWRGKNKVTDVLSFPLEEGEANGEILISYDQARRQAKEQGHSTRDELIFLLVHGTLHTLGYDHETPKDAKVMFPLQARILTKLGISPQL